MKVLGLWLVFFLPQKQSSCFEQKLPGEFVLDTDARAPPLDTWQRWAAIWPRKPHDRTTRQETLEWSVFGAHLGHHLCRVSPNPTDDFFLRNTHLHRRFPVPGPCCPSLSSLGRATVSQEQGWAHLGPLFVNRASESQGLWDIFVLRQRKFNIISLS